MFRHKETTTGEVEKKPEPITVNPESAIFSNKASATEPVKAEPSLKELIEKNLKWSQIIYEQNRKINNKLLWANIFSWFKLIIIVGPIILAIIYLQPMLKGVWSQYGDLSGQNSATSTQQNYFNSILKFINLDPAEQEQLKASLK